MTIPVSHLCGSQCEKAGQAGFPKHRAGRPFQQHRHTRTAENQGQCDN